MGWLATQRFGEAFNHYVAAAVWAFESQPVGEDASFESEGFHRAWYHLGLCLPEKSGWFQKSLKIPGQIVPPERLISDGWAMLWGSLMTLGSYGFFFQTAINSPGTLLCDLLGTGNEPPAYAVGTHRALLIARELDRRTSNGQKFKSLSDFATHEFLSSTMRAEIGDLPPEVRSQGSSEVDPERLRLFMPTVDGIVYVPTAFELLWQVDSRKFDLLVVEDNPFGPRLDPPIDDSPVPAGDDSSSRPTPDAKPSVDGPTDSLVVELERLKALVDDGFLTEEQAEQAKRQLLDD